MFNIFAENMVREANDKIHAERKQKKTKVILKETNVRWERKSAGRKVRKRVAWSAFMDPEKNIPRQPAQKNISKQNTIRNPRRHHTSYVAKQYCIKPQAPVVVDIGVHG